MRRGKGNPVLSLKVGDVVRVRGRDDILATLDERGMLDGLPFMPEMLQYCGQIHRVAKRADKTCDTIHKTGGRRMSNAVHLDLRCGGGAHGGCGARCLLFWKEAWLERVSAAPVGDGAAGERHPDEAAPVPRVLAHSAVAQDGPAGDHRYTCQTTELFRATRPLRRWDVRQYWRDVRSGNASLPTVLKVLAEGIVAGHWRGVRLYNAVRRLLGNRPYPVVQSRCTGRTPSATLGLRPGELVQIKSIEEIAETLDANGRNRGLWFDREMVPFCGGTYRVLARVERIIDERTGRMLVLPNDCLILDGVVCSGHYSPGRLLCPRAIPPYWREIWLRRADEAATIATHPLHS